MVAETLVSPVRGLTVSGEFAGVAGADGNVREAEPLGAGLAPGCCASMPNNVTNNGTIRFLLALPVIEEDSSNQNETDGPDARWNALLSAREP